MKIRFNWAEGPAKWGNPVEVSSFAEADTLLRRRQAELPPGSPGYWKHNFDILNTAGDVIYTGRYDLYPTGVRDDEGLESPSLWAHIKGNITEEEVAA